MDFLDIVKSRLQRRESLSTFVKSVNFQSYVDSLSFGPKKNSSIFQFGPPPVLACVQPMYHTRHMFIKSLCHELSSDYLPREYHHQLNMMDRK